MDINNMKVTSFSLPQELDAWFTEYAKFCEVSKSYLIRESIKFMKRSAEYGGYESKL